MEIIDGGNCDGCVGDCSRSIRAGQQAGEEKLEMEMEMPLGMKHYLLSDSLGWHRSIQSYV